MISLLRFGSSQEVTPKKKLNQIALTTNALAQRGATNMRLDTIIQDFFQARNITTTGNVSADKLPGTGARLFDEINRANIRLKSGEPPENEALIEAIQSFLEAGGNIHNTRIDNNSLLHMTVGNGCPKSTELLLSHGADAYMEDGAGKTSWDVIDEQEGVVQQLQLPKEHPHRKGLEATRKVLQANDKALKQLKLAVITPNKINTEKPDEEVAVTEAVRHLVEENGFNVNATLPPSVYQPGGSLLHLLTRYAYPTGIQYLLEKEADMEKEDNQGCNPNMVLKAQQKAYPGNAVFNKVQSLFRPYLPLTNKKYAEAINKLNEHLPANRESLTEEPEESVSWIQTLEREAGEGILHQTKVPGLNKDESLFELFAIAGWPKATEYLLNNNVDPRMKGSNDKTISGLLDQQAHRHQDSKALKDTQKVLSRTVQKAAALVKAKKEATEAIQRAERGEKGETEALTSAITSYTKLCNGFDSMVMEDKTFLHLSAKYGWPKTAAKLLALGLDPRSTTDDEDEITSFDLIENSLAAVEDSPQKAQQKEDLLSTQAVLLKNKSLWDATTVLEEAMDAAHTRKDEHSKYGDTPESEKAVLDFINAGGDVNKPNRFFPAKGSTLHAIAIYGMKNSVAPVIKAGGDLSIPDPDGETPLAIVQGEQRALRTQIQEESNNKTRILLRRELKKLGETESVLKEFEHELESRAKAKQGLGKDGKMPIQQSSQSTTNTGSSVSKGDGVKNTPKAKSQRTRPKNKNQKQTPAKKVAPTAPPPPVYDAEAAKRQSDEALEKKRALEAEKALKKQKQQELEEANRKAKQDKLEEKRLMREMQAEIEQLEAQIAKTTAEAKEQEAKIPALENAAKKRDGQINQLQQRQTTLESTLVKKRNELSRLEQARLKKKQQEDGEKSSLEEKIRALETRRKEQDAEMSSIHRKMGPAQARLTSLEVKHSALESLNAQYPTKMANAERELKETQYRLEEAKIRKEFEPAEGGGWFKISGANTGIWVPQLPLPTQENPFRIDLGTYKH